MNLALKPSHCLFLGLNIIWQLSNATKIWRKKTIEFLPLALSIRPPDISITFAIHLTCGIAQHEPPLWLWSDLWHCSASMPLSQYLLSSNFDSTCGIAHLELCHFPDSYIRSVRTSVFRVPDPSFRLLGPKPIRLTPLGPPLLNTQF